MGPAGRRGTHLKFEVPNEGSCDWKGVPWVYLKECAVPQDAVSVLVDVEGRHLLWPCVGDLVRHQNWDFERDAWRSGVRAWRLERVRHRETGPVGGAVGGSDRVFRREDMPQGPEPLRPLPFSSRRLRTLAPDQFQR